MQTRVATEMEIHAVLDDFADALEAMADAERTYETAALHLQVTRATANQRVRHGTREKMTESYVDALVTQDETVATAEDAVIAARHAMRQAQGTVEVQRERVRFLRLLMQQEIAQLQGQAA